MDTKSTIGIFNESSLHASLKAWYSRGGGETERQVGNFVCDVHQRDGSIVEIQLGSFAPLLKKTRELCTYAPIKLVHPIARECWITTLNKDGSMLRRRKSPKKGTIWHIFDALVHAPPILGMPNCSIEILLVSIEEIRRADGRGSWRRKGVCIEDKVLKEIHEALLLTALDDWKQFIPLNLQQGLFTSAELAKEAGIPPNLARKTLYVLKKANLLQEGDRQGKYKTYSLGS